MRKIRITAIGLLLAATICPAQTTITEFPIPTSSSVPNEITLGPDGALWFTERNAGQIGRITTSGVITEFPVAPHEPYGITVGPDLNLWVTAASGDAIVRMTTWGASITPFSLPGGTDPVGITAGPDGNLWFTQQPGSGPINIESITTAGVLSGFVVPSGSNGIYTIVKGPDGNLWFTDRGANEIGRITTAGVVTQFTISTSSSGPVGIALGADGNLWFTEEFGNQIGRITPGGVITEFPIATGGSLPWDITAGPDGNLWFAEYGANQIGRITTSGVITEFPVPTSGAQPVGITRGPDGNLWFTEYGANKIGRVNIASLATGVTEYPIPTSSSVPNEITLGPDGALWFTERNAGQIGRITTSGVITEFPVAPREPYGITVGPDLNLWFTAASGDAIVKLTTWGTSTTPFSLPGGTEPVGITAGPDGNLWFTQQPVSGPINIESITTAGVLSGFVIPSGSNLMYTIIRGPDGNLWFTDRGANQIGRITTAGVVTQFSVPTGGSGPVGLALGSDGNLWFTEEFGNQIGRITPGGVMTEFPIPTGGSLPWDIAAAPDGNLWFAEYGGNQIGRITTAGVITEFPVPTSGGQPLGISAGWDGNVWFTEYGANKIGKISTLGIGAGLVTLTPSATLGLGSVAVGETSAAKTVTLTNHENMPLNFSSITTSAGFALASNTCGASIAAGAKCAVGVTFSPAVTGAATGTLTFTDDAANSPQSVALTGTGVAPVTLAPSVTVGLGSVAVGETSAAKTITLTNHENIPLNFASILTTAGFTLASNTCGASIAAEATCTVSVTFSPIAISDATGTLTFTDDAANSPQSVALTGTGVAPVTLAPAVTLGLGSVAIGETSAAKTVTLTNHENIPLNFSSIATTAGFTLASNPCGASIAAGATCTVGVTFSPTVTGGATGTLTFTDDAANSPQSVALTGTGVAPVTLAPAVTLGLGSVAVGETSAAKTVTLTNHENMPLNFSSIVTTAGFALANNTCGASIAAGATCTVSVTFSPIAISDATGSLTFADDAANSPQSVALTGTGVAPVTLAPSVTLGLGSEAVGETSAAKTITLTNHENIPLNFSSVVTTAGFSLASNTCGTSIAAGSTCTVGVTFSPTSTGAATGTLTFTDDAANSPQFVALTGTGK